MASARSATRTWRLVRASSTAPDPLSVVSLARPFASSVAVARGAVLLAVRDETGMANYLQCPNGQASDRVADNLSAAVSARAEAVPELPPLETGAVAWLVARPSAHASRETQAGGDPTLVAQYLARNLQPGSWLALTLRSPTRREVRATRTWYAHRLSGAGTHHSNEGEALVMSLIAGGDDAADVAGLLTGAASALPGFDIEARAAVGQERAAASLTGVAGIGAWLGAGLGLHAWPAGAVAGSLTLGGAVLLASDLGPSRSRSLKKTVRSGTLPAPRLRRLPARSPREESRNEQGKRIRSSAGDYPLDASSFLVGPSVVVGLAAPHAGAASGASATMMRSAPASMLTDIGPAVGVAGPDRRTVHIPAAALASGIACEGRQGSGKSAVVRSLFGWLSTERVTPSGRDGYPGAANTLIAFESKPDGTEGYRQWIAATGDEAMIVELSDPASPAIDLFGAPGAAAERASAFVTAMVYAFGDGAIQDRSFESLTSVVTAALVVLDEAELAHSADICRAANIPDPATGAAVETMSPVALAHTLLGGAGDGAGVAVAAAMATAVKNLPASDPVQISLRNTLGRLAPLYGAGVTPAQRRTLAEAPRNKLALLMEAPSWWDPQRPRATWEDILTNHWAVVVNLGTSTSGAVVNDRLTATVSAMLLHTLREAIRATCGGWQAQGRTVTVFADELAELVGSSPDVVTWLHDKGRSYGICPIFATQRGEQLLPIVRSSLRDYGTYFWFQQSNPDVAAEAAADLAADGSLWSPADIVGLDPYVAVVRATVGMRRQPGVPVVLGNWEADLPAYVAAQRRSTGVAVPAHVAGAAVPAAGDAW